MDFMKEEIANLQHEVKEQKEEIIRNEKNSAILGDLFDKGIINKDGNFL